ncbi:PREDICTED: uncharacterized protein LOC108562782 [Nicrophorus vespilloides]|uniref:Uncharacterized protein LOC108562782 n=1 Tax=Nicrophorus vespilloides TaxID=110193 RepID=A0ABM1MQ53_NICVS|nr:PREDICTED: uncharacterized protein LOC108562782 [Nicrophorus vespilloides]
MDLENFFIYNNNEFNKMIYKEFFGPPEILTSERKELQNPLDRYFALKRLLLLPDDIESSEVDNLTRTDAIEREIEEVSKILYSDPPNVVEYAPWSKHVTPFCNMIKDNTKDTVATEAQSSKPLMNRGFKVCLSTHEDGFKTAVTSQEVFYPHSSDKPPSEAEGLSKDTDKRVHTANYLFLTKTYNWKFINDI